MHRDTQNVILLLLGATLVRITADDTVLRYVRPGHRWWVLGAGIVIVLLAAVAALRDHVPRLLGRSGRSPAGHAHGGPERHAAWLMVVPAIVLAVAAPAALGADAVTRTPLPDAAPVDVRYAPLPPGSAPELTLTEFVGRAGSDGGATLAGRTVTLTGFAVPGGEAPRLARIAISCCAADARPQTVRLVGGAGPAHVPPDTWLRVRGVLQPGSASSATRWVPAVQVASVEVVPVPVDPYEY
ncbi:TIGR03943 family protein [Pseudonocardia yuanmonensis]|uniref:TIGR03943 family protein n=1 Tax=Pseudonocardia yuanmonensis TaxID=1095914 RepID=A0ABP8WS62_9PSEU